MAVPQKVTPYKGTDFDVSESFIEELKAVFLKNVTNTTNDNSRSSLKEGSNEFAYTPLESNQLYCNLTLPAGINYTVGFKYFKEINQGFVCVYNSNNDHFIYRIKGNTGDCEIVYRNACLNFQLNPLYFIGETRMAIETTCRFNKVTQDEENVIYLILVDDYNDQKMICVEDSINTHFFNKTDFPYFDIVDDSCTDCNYISLGLPQNLDCIVIETIERDLDDADEILKSNLINYTVWQFRVKPIDVWARAGEHGVISYPYISVIGGSCVQASAGLPRCLKLGFNAGCPIIDKWQIEYRKCNGNINGLSTVSDWFIHDTIEKYNNCENKNWWERSLNTDSDRGWTYDSGTNTITYTFCADKGCQPVPVRETNRNENYLPIISGGVFSINKGVALNKNTRGFEPLDCDELSKMDFTIEKPVGTNSCLNTKLVKVKIYGYIWNPFEDKHVPIRYNNSQPVFGIAHCPNNNPFAYDQVFPTDQLGFIGHFAGTSNYCISKQYKHNLATGEDIYAGGEYNDESGYAPIQVWEFMVLPGRYKFWVSSHKSKPSDPYQTTSTNVIGITSLSALGTLVEEKKELIIDVCDGNDLDLTANPVMIYDLTRIGKGCLFVDATSVNTGYLYEDELEGRPIELARVSPNKSGAIRTNYTDHNGYYFSAHRDKWLQTHLYGKKNCVYSLLASSRVSYDNSGAWHRFDKLYVYKGTDAYLSKDRATIKGKIVLCIDNNIGVAGALVLLTRGGYATTDTKGEFQITAHDEAELDTRDDQIIYSQKGSCVLLLCGPDCIYCFDNADITVPICDGTDRVIDVPDLEVRINGYNKKGPHMGGRYGIGIVEHDWLGRETFVQIQNKHYIDIPSLQETQLFDYSKILFDITGMVFKPTTKRVSFWITRNLNEGDYITWVAERFQFIDNTGKVNTAAPTKIRLYYEGLGEYNKQYDFSTNTAWDFIDNTELQNVVTGDEIEFIANGDGTIFTKKITELVTYDKIGKFITIAYTQDLKDLKDGCLIRIKRRRICQEQEFFYELCPMIKVIDGIPQVLTGELQFFDSYLLNRQIPVPVTTTLTSLNSTGGIIETSVTENQLKTYPFLFEHHSPSDLWGDHCWSKGRVNVVNPFENRLCLNTEICVSKALTLNNLLNGLNYFDVEDTVVFDEQEWGPITGCFATLNEILVICGVKNFTVPFNDTNIRVDENGKVYAPTIANRFGVPRKSKGGDFGVQVYDINTLSRDNDIIMGLDTINSALVIFSFGAAEDVSGNGALSYIRSNVRAVKINNNDDLNRKKYFHGCIDTKNNKYLLTLTTLQQVDVDYINDLDENNAGINDTLVFDIENKSFYGTRSYTPEYYGGLSGDINDKQLISFRYGQAWMQNRLNNSATSFNNFFGTQCESIFEFVFNLENTKEKHFMWLETYCKELLLYADRIKTSSGQQSRIMPLWWEKRGKFWVADFKCDLNTVADANIPVETGANALLDGDSLFGTWVKVRLRPKQGDSNKYFEFISCICYMNPFEKSGT